MDASGSIAETDSMSVDTEPMVADTVASISDPDVDIAPPLRNASGTTEFFVRFEPHDTVGLESRTEAVSSFQSQADAAQQPLIALADGNPHLEIRERYWLLNGALVEADLEAFDLEHITTLPGVERLHPDYEMEMVEPLADTAVQRQARTPGDDTLPSIVTPTSPQPTLQTGGWETTYGLEQINVTGVWDEYGQGSSDVTVAVLDTGADTGHEDIDVDGKWEDYTDENCSTPCDGEGHGTHVQGTIGGGDAGGTWIGVAPDVTIAHAKIFDDFGSSAGKSEIVSAMQWAVDSADADIMSNSWGRTTPEEDYAEPIENARKAGTIPIFASGNIRAGGPIGSPSDIHGAINVGATKESEYITPFSSGNVIDMDERWDDPPEEWEEWPETKTVPDLAAPGVLVWSADTGTTDELTAMSGTSMAAPHVSGALGLLVSHSDRSPEEALEALKATAWKPDPSDYGFDVQDIRYGYGTIDVYDAFQYQPMSVSIVDDNAPVDEGDTLEVDVEVTNEGDATGVETVSLTYEGVGVVDERTVELGAGDSTTVTMTYTPEDGEGDLDEVTIEAVTYSDHDQTAVTVEPAGYLTVTDMQASETLGQDVDHRVEATIENLAGESVIRSVEYRFGVGTDVGVVGTDTTVGERANLASTIESWVDDDVINSVEEVPAADVVEVTADREYDLLVINDFDDNAAEFIDTLEGTGIGVIYLGGHVDDTYSDITSHALEDLSDVRDDPAEVETAGDWDEFIDDAVRFELTQEHHILPDDWDVGEDVHVYGSISGDVAAFSEYDGEALATLSHSSFAVDGTTVGINESRNEVLLSSARSGDPATGVEAGTYDAQYTRTSNEMLAKSIEYLARGIEIEEETVSIDAGEQKTVAFDHQVGDNQFIDDYTHGVATDREVMIEGVEIVDAEPTHDIESIAAPGGAGAGEEISVSADLSNVGESGGMQDLELWFGDRPADVLVVDEDESVADTLRNTIAGEVDAVDDIDAIDATAAEALLAEMDEYDVFVLNSFDSEETATSFQAELDTTRQHAVYLDMKGVADGGIRSLNSSEDVLSAWGTNSSEEAAMTRLSIEEDHELFTGVGEEGEVVDIADTDTGEYYHISGYDGTKLATVGNSNDGIDPAEWGVAINETHGEVLLGLGRGTEAGESDYTDAANAILGNAVELLATDLDPKDVVNVTDVHLDAGDAETVTLTHTIDDDHPDETVTVGMRTPAAELTDSILVAPPNAVLDIVATNDPIDEEETLVVDVDVTNVGGATADQDISLDYTDDGTDDDISGVTVAHGETDSITLEATTEKGDWGDAVPIVIESDHETVESTVTIQEIDQLLLDLGYPVAHKGAIDPVDFTFVPRCHYEGGCTNATLYYSELSTVNETENVATSDEWDAGEFDGTTSDTSEAVDELRLGYRDGAADDSLLRYYRFDDVDGGTVADYSGNDAAADVVDVTDGVEGVFGTDAIDVADGYADPSPVSLDDRDVVTIGTWFEVDDSPSGGDSLGDAIVSWGHEDWEAGVFLGISIGEAQDQCTVGQIQWQVHNGTAWTAVCGPEVTEGDWHHILATVSESGELALWVDGTQHGSVSFDDIDGGVTDTVHIGTTTDDDGDFAGSIEEFQLYEESLTIETAPGPSVTETLNASGEYEYAFDPRPDREQHRPTEWTNVSVSTVIPDGTSVDMEARSISEAGDPIDQQQDTLPDGVETIEFDLEPSAELELDFELASETPTVTPSIDGFELRYEETVATDWGEGETLETVDNDSTNRFEHEFGGDLPTEIVWNVRGVQEDDKVRWAENQTAVVASEPPVVSGEDNPQDLNGDGLYRDILGDSELSIFDVQIFFDNRNSQAVTSFSRAYNFAGADETDVSIFDVQALFDYLQEEA